MRRYLCPKVLANKKINANRDEPFWQKAPWTEDFVDILGGAAPNPRFKTHAKLCWDDEALYILADMEEPHLWATLTEHDSVIFQDNDFEVFLDPDGDAKLYAELEVNALNTTWDLLLVTPYREGGPALNGWEIKGLETAVSLRGTLNDPTDIDDGWTLEIKLPWLGLKEICSSVACPPNPGDIWRLNFSRVQWHLDVVQGGYVKRPDTSEDNWVWSPQGVIDMHQPEQWGYLEFTAD